eukprot:4223168-Pleurochrysis_carterae.AAC.1
MLEALGPWMRSNMGSPIKDEDNGIANTHNDQAAGLQRSSMAVAIGMALLISRCGRKQAGVRAKGPTSDPYRTFEAFIACLVRASKTFSSPCGLTANSRVGSGTDAPSDNTSATTQCDVGSERLESRRDPPSICISRPPKKKELAQGKRRQHTRTRRAAPLCRRPFGESADALHVE